jgi:hypothetical protein
MKPKPFLRFYIGSPLLGSLKRSEFWLPDGGLMGIPPAFSEGACTPRPNSFIPEPTRATLKNSYFCGSFFSRFRSVDSTFFIKSRSRNFKTIEVTAILSRCKSGGGRLPSLRELFLIISHGRCGLAVII